MIQKPIEQVTKADIDSLVSAKQSEQRTLEYKLQLPGGGSDEKREFLYDVSSFANASGGDLVFGVSDEKDSNGKSTGLPGSAEGIAIINATDTLLRLENLVRDGIDPRIPGVQWKLVEGFSKGPVVVMRIPQSWAGPHMVTFGGVSRFYSRNSAGKYPLDVGELRSAFLSQTGLGDRIKRFVIERISKVAQGDSPVPLSNGAKALLHLIPVVSLASTGVQDVAKNAISFQSELRPMTSGAWGARYNFDGVLVAGSANSYVQVFRSGIIEAGDSQLFGRQQSIPSVAFERHIFHAASNYLGVQQKMGLSPPIFLVVTLVGVKGYILGLDELFRFTHYCEPVPVDRDTLFLPEVLIENYSVDATHVLRPAFDALWQACGLEGSANYDPSGNWRPH